MGTWDGFWAFELERRGADVVALDLDDERDLDWPPRRRPAAFPDEPRGRGFALARELLGSAVDRRNLSVYDATPDELGGQFDLVFCGSVLIHLRDQLLALGRMAAPDELVGALGPVRWADALRPTPLMEWLDDGVQFDYGRIEGKEAGWWHFYTANVSVKRSLLERAGGFDAGRFPYLYEDLDLAYRISQLGFRLRYDRAARAEHLVAPTLAAWRERMPALARAERAFVGRHPELLPYFHDRFVDVLAQPRARGVTGRLQPLVPRGVPWLGPRVWVSAKERAARELAHAYVAAW